MSNERLDRVIKEIQAHTKEHPDSIFVSYYGLIPDHIIIKCRYCAKDFRLTLSDFKQKYPAYFRGKILQDQALTDDITLGALTSEPSLEDLAVIRLSRFDRKPDP